MMRDLISKIVGALERGQAGALVTVIESRGSSPRGAGASMFVLPDGESFGTIGGGVLEHTAAVQAVELLKKGETAVENYGLNNTEAGALGMVCGGTVEVLIEPVAPGTQIAAAMRQLSERSALGENLTLRRRVEKQEVTSIEVLPGRCMRAELIRDGEAFTFIENVGPEGRVFVFGGGHVSAALVPLLNRIHFSVTVCEDRAEFATKARFPDADAIIVEGYEKMFDRLGINSADYLISMTRGHEADLAILKQALKTNAAYIGCIGSRHKIDFTRGRLLELGFTEEDFKRIHTPVGLPIGAQTPEEIAVSIAAELIAHRAGAVVQ